MQKWSCYTEVEAFKIDAIGVKHNGHVAIYGGDVFRIVRTAWFDRFHPNVGGYFVIEYGSYLYLSAKEFEGRYSISVAVEMDTSGVIPSQKLDDDNPRGSNEAKAMCACLADHVGGVMCCAGMTQTVIDSKGDKWRVEVQSVLDEDDSD